VKEGDLLNGKYRIVRVIGKGAMGTVWEAREARLRRKVAIKVLNADVLERPQGMERFLQEATNAAQLRSDHAADIYEVATPDGGAPYIVMEYLEGSDLAERLRIHRSFPVAQAVDFILQACDAVAEANELGIIHRDIKPANLFAVERPGCAPRIKVLDFGISKAKLAPDTLPPGACEPMSVETEPSVPFGSLPYMSPEQMESARDVDARTDVWALGVTLWELVTGERPFPMCPMFALHSMIMSGVRLRIRDKRPDVTPELESVLYRCLAADREDRFASVRELATALEQAMSGSSATQVSPPWTPGPAVNPVHASPRLADVVPSGHVASAAKTPPTGTPAPARNPNLWRALGVGAALIALAPFLVNARFGPSPAPVKPVPPPSVPPSASPPVLAVPSATSDAASSTPVAGSATAPTGHAKGHEKFWPPKQPSTAPSVSVAPQTIGPYLPPPMQD
jgi:serine/threonine-protein kinase